ncbi:MAG: lipid A export permease/ATP-binding protein MsbA [Syntrophobacteraceae bacterium]|nr:lipid A export permease/ATP-binding protein MsbA [Syntrophobacteraceae bacterium]
MNKELMGVYTRLLRLAAPHWRRLALAMVCMLGVAGTSGASAYLVKPVLDDIFVNKKMDMLELLSMAVMVLFIVKGLCTWGNTYLMSYVGQSIVARLRQQIYDHLQDLSVSYYDRTQTGSIMARIVNDVNQMQSAVSDSITGLLKDFFSIVGLLVVVFHRDWQLALIAIVVLPVAFLPLVKFGRMLRRTISSTLQTYGNLSVILHETITGHRIVKAFCMEDYEKSRFAEENQTFFGHSMRSVSIRALSSPLMELLGGIGIVCIIVYGGYSVIEGKSTPGNFFSFLTAVIMLYEPVKRLTNVYNAIQQGLAAGLRVFEILDTPSEIQEKPNAVTLAPMKESIEFKDATFRYGDKRVLSGINLKVKAGEIVAIVGVSGAGKSTLVNLIPRFYDIDEGAILIDGTDIRDATLASLRGQIGLVTQQPILFNDTVRNNIAYGSAGKSDEEIFAAARAAHAHDFIIRMPQGFDTIVGEQGVRLSGGERQRLCIARALLKNAPILILDEATSSLDSESEMEVQKALENLMVGRTTLVIAHRLSTIQNAHRIVALADGHIVEEGSHEQLMHTTSEYRRLYELQLSQFDSGAIPVGTDNPRE